VFHPWLDLIILNIIMTIDSSLERYSRQMRFSGVGVDDCLLAPFRRMHV